MKNPLSNVNIPLFSLPDGPIIAASQEHVPIAKIVGDIILHKDGGAALILESTSLNFGLLSAQEQEAVIAAYAALLNSLSFSTQILVRTQRKDITKYLNNLDEAYKKIESPKLQRLMIDYRRFITETITKKNVLEKRFFLVVPFFPYELGVTKSFKTTFFKRAGPLPYSQDFVLQKAKIALYPKRDHLIRQAARLGLRLRQLNNEQITALFYEVYNPEGGLPMDAKNQNEIKS